MGKEQDIPKEFSLSSYHQISLPIEEDLDRLLIEEQQRRDHELENKFPGLRRSFGAMLSTLYYFYTPDELGGSTLEFPMGAIIGKFNETEHSLSTTHNQVNAHKNSLDHAEKVAIEEVLKKTGNKHLPEGSVLESLVEPCGMCSGAFYHAGGQTIIYSLSQEEMRGMTFVVNGERKSFRTEPKGYTVEDFMRERNPHAQIYGGYRKFDVLKFFNFWQEDFITPDGQRPRTFSLHEDMF